MASLSADMNIGDLTEDELSQVLKQLTDRNLPESEKSPLVQRLNAEDALNSKDSSFASLLAATTGASNHNHNNNSHNNTAARARASSKQQQRNNRNRVLHTMLKDHEISLEPNAAAATAATTQTKQHHHQAQRVQCQVDNKIEFAQSLIEPNNYVTNGNATKGGNIRARRNNGGDAYCGSNGIAGYNDHSKPNCANSFADKKSNASGGTAAGGGGGDNVDEEIHFQDVDDMDVHNNNLTRRGRNDCSPLLSTIALEPYVVKLKADEQQRSIDGDECAPNENKYLDLFQSPPTKSQPSHVDNEADKTKTEDDSAQGEGGGSRFNYVFNVEQPERSALNDLIAFVDSLPKGTTTPTEALDTTCVSSSSSSQPAASTSTTEPIDSGVTNHDDNVAVSPLLSSSSSSSSSSKPSEPNQSSSSPTSSSSASSSSSTLVCLPGPSTPSDDNNNSGGDKPEPYEMKDLQSKADIIEFRTCDTFLIFIFVFSLFFIIISLLLCLGTKPDSSGALVIRTSSPQNNLPR